MVAPLRVNTAVSKPRLFKLLSVFKPSNINLIPCEMPNLYNIFFIFLNPVVKVSNTNDKNNFTSNRLY